MLPQCKGLASSRCPRFSSGAVKKARKENPQSRFPDPPRRNWRVSRASAASICSAALFLKRFLAARKLTTRVFCLDPRENCWRATERFILFDVDLAQGVSLRESATRAFGSSMVVAETELCRMGLTVCYDLRFPELYRGLVDQGAQLIFVPSAFTAYTGQAHWEPLLRARAIENQVYVIAPGQFGKSTMSFETHGHSMIVDPWGKVIGELPDGPGVVVAEIDLDYLAKVRAELPALTHRKLR